MAKNYRRSWLAVPGGLVEQTFQLAGGTSEIEMHGHYCLRQDPTAAARGFCLWVPASVPALLESWRGRFSEKIPGIEIEAS